MKHPYLILGSIFAAALFVLPSLAENEHEDVEFYFTRLVYARGTGPPALPSSIFDVRTWKPARAARGSVVDGVRIFLPPTASSCGVSSA